MALESSSIVPPDELESFKKALEKRHKQPKYQRKGAVSSPAPDEGEEFLADSLDNSKAEYAEDYALIDDIATYRDIANDYPLQRTKSIKAKLTGLEQKAFDLLSFRRSLESGEHPVRVTIVGYFNSGKSSFINSLLGQEVCPTDECPTTSSVTEFVHGDEQRIVSISDSGEEREITLEGYKEHSRHKTSKKSTSSRFRYKYYYPFASLRSINLIDTPGFQNPSDSRGAGGDTDLTEAELQRADVVIFVHDINAGELNYEELDWLSQLRLEEPQRLYLLLNRADKRIEKEQQEVEQRIREQNKEKGLRVTEIFSYSAKNELQRAVQNDFIPLLESLLGTMRHRITQPLDFRAVVVGKHEGRKLRIDLDDTSIMEYKFINASPTSRDSLIQLLKDIGKNQYQHNRYKYKRKEAEYRRAQDEALTLINRKLSDVEDHEDDDKWECLAEQARDFCYEIPNLGAKLKNMLRGGLKTKITPEGIVRTYYAFSPDSVDEIDFTSAIRRESRKLLDLFNELGLTAKVPDARLLANNLNLFCVCEITRCKSFLEDDKNQKQNEILEEMERHIESTVLDPLRFCAQEVKDYCRFASFHTKKADSEMGESLKCKIEKFQKGLTR